MPPSRTVLTGINLRASAAPVDITVSGGVITSIAPSSSIAETLLLPLMADAHVHLDKTFTVDRTGAQARSLFDAIDRMDADKVNWTDDDLYTRGSRALDRAWRHGVAAMRSHVDWTTADTPRAWTVLGDLAREWRGRVDLQLASLSPIDLLAECGDRIAAQVQADGGVLGAFVYRNDDLKQKLTDVFTLSDRHDLPLDFHVDEGLEAQAQGFDQIVALAGQRREAPSVLCGHACALSVRPEEDVSAVLNAAASAGVGLVVLPTTNGYLQDNTPGRTPRLRGIAPMQEAATAGVDVIIASDNVRDVFYPYGDYDLLDVFRGCVHLAHLTPGDWLDAISARAAHWCHATIAQPAIGQPADFITITATDLQDTLSRPGATRTVWRNGVALT